MKLSVILVLVFVAIVAVHGLTADADNVDQVSKPEKRAILETIVGAVVGRVVGKIIDHIFSNSNRYSRGRFGLYDVDGKENDLTEVDVTSSDLWIACNCRHPWSNQNPRCTEFCRRGIDFNDLAIDSQVAYEEIAGRRIDETKNAEPEPELEVSTYACNGGTIGGFYYQLAKGYSGFCNKRDNCQKVCTSEGHPNGFCAFRPTAGVCTKLIRSCWCTNNRDK